MSIYTLKRLQLWPFILQLRHHTWFSFSSLFENKNPFFMIISRGKRKKWATKICSIYVLFGINISSGFDIEQHIRILFSASSCFDLQQNWALNAYSRSALCRSFYDIKRCKSWYTQDIIFFWQEVAQMNIQIMILLVPILVVISI